VIGLGLGLGRTVTVVTSTCTLPVHTGERLVTGSAPREAGAAIAAPTDSTIGDAVPGTGPRCPLELSAGPRGTAEPLPGYGR